MQDSKMNLLNGIDGSDLIQCDKATVKKEETLSRNVPGVRSFLREKTKKAKRSSKLRGKRAFQKKG
jgi:hypothetical protein